MTFAEFVRGITQPIAKKPRSIATKSQKAIAWMGSYFVRVGDKRPDKDGIYLPICLKEKGIYSRMVEEIYSENEAVQSAFLSLIEFIEQHSKCYNSEGMYKVEYIQQ